MCTQNSVVDFDDSNDQSQENDSETINSPLPSHFDDVDDSVDNGGLYFNEGDSDADYLTFVHPARFNPETNTAEFVDE